jgi:gas vesicle protein
MKRAFRLLLTVAGGAAATWLFNPREGARRRALLRDGLRSRTQRARSLAARVGRDLLGSGHR